MNGSAMNGQVDQYDNERNHQEQRSDAQAVSQAEIYHPDHDQNSEERLQHWSTFPANQFPAAMLSNDDDCLTG